MIYLNCPFTDKDRVKALGARFNGTVKKWYVPEGLSLEPFKKWLPVTVQLEKQESLLLIPNDGKPQYTVGNFILNLQNAFYDLYNTEIWLLGQITKLKEKEKGLEIQLIDPECSNDLQSASAMTVTAWGEQSGLIVEKMLLHGLDLQEGFLVNLKVKPQFHKRYHLGGQVVDIDPAATLGELALLQLKIREKLKEEGIYNKNKLLPKPFDYTRIAVIHPSNASGFHDFKKDADILTHLNLCSFSYYSSSFEGINTETEIIQALERALKEHYKNPLDAIVIIRGGGARQGLLNLIKESIIRKICLSEIPIITGLGHADDKLLLDEVAHLTFDTPSKVVAHIKQTIQQNARDMLVDFDAIRDFSINSLQHKKDICEKMFAVLTGHAKNRIAQTNNSISGHKQAIKATAMISLNNWQNKLKLARHELGNTKNLSLMLKQNIINFSGQISLKIREILVRTRDNLDNHYATTQSISKATLKQYRLNLSHFHDLLQSFNPNTVLQRGYSLAIDSNNKVIRSKKEAAQNAVFLLKFNDGTCSIKVNEDK